MKKILNSITELIGKTPILKLNNYTASLKNASADIIVKFQLFKINLGSETLCR